MQNGSNRRNCCEFQLRPSHHRPRPHAPKPKQGTTCRSAHLTRATVAHGPGMPSVQSPTSPAATPSQAESHPPCTHARAPNADHGRPAHTRSQSAPRQTQAPEEPESKARKPRRVDGGQRNLHTHTHQKRQPGVVPKPPLPTRMLICLAKGFLVFLFGSSDDQIKAGRTYAHPQAPPTKSRPPPRSPPQGPGVPQIKQDLQRPTTLKPTGSVQRPQAPAPGAPDHWVPA